MAQQCVCYLNKYKVNIHFITQKYNYSVCGQWEDVCLKLKLQINSQIVAAHKMVSVLISHTN